MSAAPARQRRGGDRRFAALLEQRGVYLFEYADERGGFTMLGSWEHARPFRGIADATDALVNLLRDQATGGATLTIALEHFGVFQHSMALPPAEDDVVRPIVVREAQRMFGVADPVVAFGRVETDAIDRRSTPGRPPGGLVFIAGAPRDVVQTIQASLARARIRLEGIVVVPQAMRRAYDALDGSGEATAFLACLPSGPHLGYFLDGRLALAIEAPLAGDDARPYDATAIAEQLDRGSVFLRQQFGGAQASRVLLAAPPDQHALLADAIQARGSMRVDSIGQDIGTPAALVVMGAVLEARADEPMDLVTRPPSLAKRLRSAFRGPAAIAAAASIAAVASIGWSSLEVTSYMRERSAVDALRRRVDAEAPALAPMRQVAERRAGLADGITTLHGALREHQELALRLRGLADAAPVEVRFDSLFVSRSRDGWEGVVHGWADGTSAARVVRSVELFYRGVREQAGVTGLSLDHLDYVAPAGGGPAGPEMRFGLRFEGAPLGAAQAGGTRR